MPPPVHSVFSTEQVAYAVPGSQFRHETAFEVAVYIPATQTRVRSNGTTSGLSFVFHYPMGTGISYDQAGIGLETSEKSPWGAPAFSYDSVGASKRVVAIAR